jgi:repressor of nif and glnA expression
MEESVAPEAERIYQESLRNPPYGSDVRSVRAHANIRILNGRGVIEQVFIGEKTLAEEARADMNRLVK